MKITEQGTLMSRSFSFHSYDGVMEALDRDQFYINDAQKFSH